VPPSWHAETRPLEDLPTLVLFDGWNSFFRSRVVPWRMSLAEKTRQQFERQLLPRFMRYQRWYGAKAVALERAVIADHATLESDGKAWLLAIIEAHGPGLPAHYFVPMSLVFEDEEEERTRGLVGLAVTKVRQQAEIGLIADAMGDEPFCRALVAAMGAGRPLRSEGGSLRFSAGKSYAEVVGNQLEQPAPLHRLTTSSNSVSLLGERLFLKAYRRLQPGLNPELEMGRFLTDAVAFPHSVPVAGSVEWIAADGRAWTLALLQAQVTNQGDAWTATTDQLARLLESGSDDEAAAVGAIAAMAEHMQVLARRVAELHAALARRTGDAAFDPEPATAADVARWSAAVQAECEQTMQQLGQHHEGWSAALKELAARVLAAAPVLRQRIAQAATGVAPPHLKTRLHGDLHLGQVLICRDDFLLIDFEGEPQRSFEERRTKHSALRDVAGLLRSFDYARHTAVQQTAKNATDIERLAPLARRWEQQVRAAFLQAYGATAVSGGVYAGAAEFDAVQPLLNLFELEKALYELRYEIDNRPDWVGVPLAGIAALAGLSN